ncbi:kinase-like domain-containing protein [Desarmillaria ectypa]|nr:kinase-like domain-containing protein [Desarmillaria ectypa]
MAKISTRGLRDEDEDENGGDLFNAAKHGGRATHHVRRRTKSTVVKTVSIYGLFVEAEAMRFVAEHTSIPVLKFDYLVMEYIEGDQLDRTWRSLTHDQKVTVMRPLRGYVDQLQVVQQPGKVGDSFANEEEYNDWRISLFSWYANESTKVKHQLDEIRQQIRHDHRIVLTHRDIARNNVLIRVDGDGPGNVSVVALVDWGQTAWRPEYWEARKFYWVASQNGWFSLVEELLLSGYQKEIEIEERLLLISGPPR